MRICEPRFLIFILTLAGVTAFSSSVALHAAGIHADQRTPQVSPEEDPFTRAVRLFYGESASSSLSAFEEIVNKHPDDTETVLQFAALLSETGRVETAEEVFRILSKTEPENETLRFAWFKAACLSRRLATAQSILPLSVETPEAAFWEGMLLLDLGRPAEALPCLRLAAELSTYNPVAQYMMGKTLSELGRLEEAEAALTTALKQEPSLSIAVLPLARVKEALGKHAEAYNQLLKARSLLLAEAETITTEIARMEASYPTLKAERIEQREKKRKTATPPLVKPPQPRSEGEKIPLVRVGLAERLSEVFIKTGGPATIK
ncbi:MAG TPA: tetratricopeptide repeat protein, partial [Spirochaetia bacterium]|nr:tetratricopeptide repeat protein [Spirochaetia bacterium]